MMSIRLVILIVVVSILAIRFAMTSSTPPKQLEDKDIPTFTSEDGDTLETIRIKSVPLWKRDLPGEAPSDDADMDVRVEVDTSRGKNRLYLYITESHGYYVETLLLNIWYSSDNKYTNDDSPLSFTHRIINKFLKANDTLVDCLEVVPAELFNISGDIGDTKDWSAEIVEWGRIREIDPDPLPLVTLSNRCD